MPVSGGVFHVQNDFGEGGAVVCSAVVLAFVRTVDGARVPAVEVMVNSRLMSELIEKGDFFGVREALEKSMAEESQTFESDIARLILSGKIERQEGLAHADSPTNLMWRLQNDFTKASQAQKPVENTDDTPTFTEFTIDVQR